MRVLGVKRQHIPGNMRKVGETTSFPKEWNKPRPAKWVKSNWVKFTCKQCGDEKYVMERHIARIAKGSMGWSGLCAHCQHNARKKSSDEVKEAINNLNKRRKAMGLRY